MRAVRVDLAVLLPVLAVLGVAFQGPGLGAGFTLADVAIFAMIIVWLPSVRDGEPRRVLVAVALPLLLILIGSVVGSLAVGVAPWIVRDLAKDVGAFASFLAMVTLLRAGGPRVLRYVSVIAAVTAVIVAALLLSEGNLRARGGFPNPNVAAHFLGTNLIVLTASRLPRLLRITAITTCIAGLVATGSFGALLMVVGAFAYLGSRYLAAGRRPAIGRLVPVGLVAAFLLMMTNLPDTTQETGFNTKHLERSSGGRLVRWDATLDVALRYPTGIGPGSNRGLGLLPHQQEAHNEYLAYLTERSLVGLLGLVLLFAAIWRLGRAGGVTRALVIAFALQSLVRETTHYRHLWLMLALALVLDEYAERRPSAAAASPPSSVPTGRGP